MGIDPDGNLLVSLITLLVFICVSAFFSVSEAAIVALSDTKTKKMAEDGNKTAQTILKLVRSPMRFLATIQAGTTISGLLAVALVAGRFSVPVRAALTTADTPYWLSGPAITVLVTLVLAYFILIFGNLLPRRLAAYFPEQIAFAIAPVLNVCGMLLSPIVVLLSTSTNLFLRLTGQNPNLDMEAVTEEEIRMMVDVGEERGAIDESEKDMINNIFEFDSRTVEEIMTHRVELTAVENTATLEEILTVIQERGYSRIPVYEEDIDNIVGILYAKDLLSLVHSRARFKIENYLRVPFYVPASTRCIELFKEFKEQKLHMAVVVDEYGGTYGIVTMEDLLESIVGNIQDEYDTAAPEIVQLSDTVYHFDGWTSVEEVEHILDMEIPEDSEYDTIGGVIVDMLEGIPKENEHPSVIVDHVMFTVLEVEDSRISKLRADMLPRPSHTDEED